MNGDESDRPGDAHESGATESPRLEDLDAPRPEGRAPLRSNRRRSALTRTCVAPFQGQPDWSLADGVVRPVFDADYYDPWPTILYAFNTVLPVPAGNFHLASVGVPAGTVVRDLELREAASNYTYFLNFDRRDPDEWATALGGGAFSFGAGQGPQVASPHHAPACEIFNGITGGWAIPADLKRVGFVLLGGAATYYPAVEGPLWLHMISTRTSSGNPGVDEGRIAGRWTEISDAGYR